MRSKRIRLILLIFIGVFLLLVGVFLIKPSNISKYKVTTKKMVLSVYASGFIDSSDSVSIKSEASGYIEKIFVKENDTIKKGQVLAIIANNTVRENLREVEAQYNSIMEKLRPDSDFKKEFQHNIAIKKAVFENAERQFNRRKALYEEELISRERFEDIKREYEVTKRDYERVLNAYNDTIKTLEYQLESLKARKNSLLAELDKYIIKSPIEGKILRKFAKEGDYINHIQQTQPVFSVGNEKNLETVLIVDEEYIPIIKEGMKVYITLDSYPNETFEGKIKTIEFQSDRASRTVKVKADVDYGKPVFFNLTVEANILIKEVEGLFIPESAYRDGYVEIVEGRKTKKSKVEVAKEKFNGYLLVISGLREGQEVLIK